MNIAWRVARALALAVPIALIAMPKSVMGGAFSVVPQMIELTAQTRSSMVEVRNISDVETVFQVETFDWVDSAALPDLEPTRDVLAVPAVFRLAPGAVQTVRVAARGNPSPQAVEQSFRLLISEVPQAEQAGGVVFALRMSLPVFLTPQGAEPELDFELVSGGREVRLTNSGRAHLRLNDARIVNAESGQLLETVALEQPAYLLPGHSRTYPLSVALDRWQVRLEADTTAGSFQLTSK